MAARLSDPLPYQAFLEKMTPLPNGCWQWNGAKQQQKVVQGQPFYGSFRKSLAHRWSYRVHKGKIPYGLVIDHVCNNSLCVNPDHLEAVTQQVNRQRAANVKGLASHCRRGHAFIGENTRIDKHGYRVCRQCKNLHEKARQLRERI
jgi:hypothetical protein